MLIICDGGKRRDVAYGSFKIFDDSGNLLDHGQRIFGDNTSNSAEYLILYSALLRAKVIKVRKGHVTILSDSDLVVHQLQGTWNCNYAHLQVMRDAIRKELSDYYDWEIKKVSRNIIVGHLGH